MINKISIKTKLGWITAFEENNRIFRIKFGKIKKQTKSGLLKNFKTNLSKFFNKQSIYIKTKYKLEGNQIQKKIWKELKNIKFGQTKSYGEIAKKYNISPRHVGKICGQNRLMLLIPCHRVIKSDGSIGGFSSSGGINLKKKLLKFEKSF